MTNFEASRWNVSSSINLLFLRSDSDFYRNKNKQKSQNLYLSFSHSGDYPGIVFINNCDDEEDCIQGSGSGDGGTGGSNLYPGSGPSSKNGENNQAKNNEEVFYPGGTDSEFFFTKLFFKLLGLNLTRPLVP